MVIECMENVKLMKYKWIGDWIMSFVEVFIGYKFFWKKSKYVLNFLWNYGLFLCLKCMWWLINI